MRYLAAMFITTAIASAALAQTTPAPIQAIGFDGRGAPSSTVATVPIIAPPGPVTTVNVQALPPAVGAQGMAQPSTMVDPEAPVVEIGFDPKVKRDPNGKIIDDSKPGVAAPVAQAVRNDNKLGGDAAMFNKKSSTPVPAPVENKPVSNADLLKQMQEMQQQQKNKPNFPTAISVQGGQAQQR